MEKINEALANQLDESKAAFYSQILGYAQGKEVRPANARWFLQKVLGESQSFQERFLKNALHKREVEEALREWATEFVPLTILKEETLDGECLYKEVGGTPITVRLRGWGYTVYTSRFKITQYARPNDAFGNKVAVVPDLSEEKLGVYARLTEVLEVLDEKL